MIDSMSITPLASGFLLAVWSDGSDDSVEYAYSDFEDLMNALTLMLGPSPKVIGMDMAAPGSEKSMLGYVRDDGLIESLDPDDGWRLWENPDQKKFPPGVRPDDTVEVRLADSNITPANRSTADQWNWRWRHDGRQDDIIAYRVVKP